MMTTAAPALLVLLIGANAVRSAGLQWRTTAFGREATCAVPSGGKPGFTSLPAEKTGIHFTNRLTELRGITNQIFMSGSGVAAGDVDGDGWCDLYFCGLDTPNVLYRNLGNWKFENVTVASGVSCGNQPSTGAVFADIDGDGDLDLLVAGLGCGVRLFANDGKGKFREMTSEAGLTSNAASMSMALADIDGDGDLDLYVANYRTSSLQDELGIRFRVRTANNSRVITHIDGRPVTTAERERYSVSAESNMIVENGEADFFYRNEGNGKFSLVSWTGGSFLDEDGQRLSSPPYDWGLSVMFRDINGDGAPDIYVCNDSDSPDRIWLNDGHGGFRAMPQLAVRQTCLASMGIDFADINRDGLDDFFVADMLSRDHAVRHTQMLDGRRMVPPGHSETRQQFMRNMLYLNRGDGTYAEIAQLAGLDASDWSWMPAFLDVDLDGFEDLLITTGLERSLRDADARRQIDAIKGQGTLTKQEFLELRRMMPRLTTPNHAYRNRGDLTFEDVSAAWGFNSTQVSQGMALADLDNDGDLDVVVNCMNECALIYRNDSSAPRIAIRLQGKSANSRGIGARIKITGGPVPQSQEMIAGGRYLSCDDAMRVFAAGSATSNLSVEVFWPGGARSAIHGVYANHIYNIEERLSASRPASQIVSTVAPALFEDASDLLKHTHWEMPFNDFDRQPLLPRQFSRNGPGLCWSDLNRDGWDDLVIGAARGSALAMFINKRSQAFTRIDTTAMIGKAVDDETTILSWPAESGATLLVGVSGYETGTASKVNRSEFWPGGLEVRECILMPGGCVGPLALADIDGDGDLDLFAGAISLPGRYPEPGISRLFTNDGQHFQAAQEFSLRVNGALFSDLDNDGFPELVLACDWGPVRVYHNNSGKFIEATDKFGLSKFKGWWNAVATGDFDGDGQIDLVAANWGRNSKHQSYIREPLRVYFGDLDGNGTTELIEAYQDSVLRKIVPWARLDFLSQHVPSVAQRFATFKTYSEASVQELFGQEFGALKELQANTLDSMVFLNRGDHFEAKPLPIEAQFAPAFGICVADFDGDGNQDIFLAQNFFGPERFTSRYDAGRGLVLKGHGNGSFEPLTAGESGIQIYGEQRGAALADFDHDGRIDLAVAQNGASTKLYRNRNAKAGLRVRLRGAAGNPNAIGAVIRQFSSMPVGPAWEIHAGSGYWSQDSAAVVLTSSSLVTNLWIRWPGGREMTYAIPVGAREVSLAVDGKIDAPK
jgi:hypothetical protein